MGCAASLKLPPPAFASRKLWDIRLPVSCLQRCTSDGVWNCSGLLEEMGKMVIACWSFLQQGGDADRMVIAILNVVFCARVVNLFTCKRQRGGE